MSAITEKIKGGFVVFAAVLESHTASVFIPGKKFGEDADQLLSLPVQCSFWAFTDSSQRSGKLDSSALGTVVSRLLTNAYNIWNSDD